MNHDQTIQTEILLKAHNAAVRVDEVLTAAQWDMPHPSRYSESFAARWDELRRAVRSFRMLTAELSRES